MNRNEKALIRMIDVQLLLAEGHSKAEISRLLGVSYETIRRHINDYHQESPPRSASHPRLAVVGWHPSGTGQLETS